MHTGHRLHKAAPDPATGTAVEKPPAASCQCRQVKPPLGALNKQSGMREGIPDISGSEGRSPEPRLLSRSDWLPPPTLMAWGRAVMLSLGWVRAGETDRNKGKHLSNTSQTSQLEKPVSPASPFLFSFFFFLFGCYFIDRIKILILVSYFLKAEKSSHGTWEGEMDCKAHGCLHAQDATARILSFGWWGG